MGFYRLEDIVLNLHFPPLVSLKWLLRFEFVISPKVHYVL